MVWRQRFIFTPTFITFSSQRFKKTNHRRKVVVLTNDTLVESPFVDHYVKQQIEVLENYFHNFSFPFRVIKTVPEAKNTFWVNLIGKGYPAPTRHFRWCTDRMKIRPTTAFIKQITANTGYSTLLTGVRRSESSERAKVAKKFDKFGRLIPHQTLENCFVFRPILEWSTDDVWEYLASNKPHWGGTYDNLIELYRDAIGGECPVVIDPDAAPSCGSSSIRFGCWTCTVVQKDKSFRGSIENKDKSFEPMADFRDWLKSVSADKTRRMNMRRTGHPGLGPMNFQLREEILEKVLSIQEKVGLPLISEEEISEIERIWRVDEKMFDAYFRFAENRKNEETTNEDNKITC